MEISIVKNCVRRVQPISTSNVKIANRISANGKRTEIQIHDVIGFPGYTVCCETGTVYGKRGKAIGSRREDGRYSVHFNKDGKQIGMFRSRVVAEAMLGRKLKKGEEVDHKNNIVSDDRGCNLAVVDHKSNMNNPLTIALRKSKTKKYHSDRIEFTGETTTVSRKRNYKVETAK